jgi:large subunit ribosomal protein L23
METHEVLLRPVISEKSTFVYSTPIGPKDHPDIHLKYTFEVSPRANKIEIRRAVEEKYRVRVKSVRIINMPAKEKGAGFVAINKRRRGLTSPWKKAIVTLHSGQNKIEDFFGAV